MIGAILSPEGVDTARPFDLIVAGDTGWYIEKPASIMLNANMIDIRVSIAPVSSKQTIQ